MTDAEIIEMADKVVAEEYGELSSFPALLDVPGFTNVHLHAGNTRVMSRDDALALCMKMGLRTRSQIMNEKADDGLAGAAGGI